jgi:hypothetical protein
MDGDDRTGGCTVTKAPVAYVIQPKALVIADCCHYT